MTAVYFDVFFLRRLCSASPDSFELQSTPSEVHRELARTGADSAAAEIRFQHRK